MKRKITRTKGAHYCTVEIEVSDGRLSVCGEEGEIVTRPQARKRAIEYWESFFEDNPGELMTMNLKQGTRFTSSKSAAKYVLRCDGEFHGLDAKERDGKILLGHSFGQITDTIGEFFPEVKPLLPWHLNDLKAGCEHQEALGWGPGKTITLPAENAHGGATLVEYKDSIGAPCPTCGYKYGTAWLKRELPPEIVKLAETVCG